MHFEVLGPYYLSTNSIVKTEHVIAMKKTIADDQKANSLLTACGCYVFGIKSSGASRVMPWYVGKAERRSVLSEATNSSHLQLYNEILDEYKRGHPALYFLPTVTPGGKPRIPTKSDNGVPSVDFLEDWLIATSLKTNGNLWNINKTKKLRELYVRGIFNPKVGDLNSEASSLKECLGI